MILGPSRAAGALGTRIQCWCKSHMHGFKGGGEVSGCWMLIHQKMDSSNSPRVLVRLSAMGHAVGCWVMHVVGC